MQADKSPQILLRCTEFGLDRGQTQVLHDINWQVQAGEHWAILGPNGSGKTSLLACLTGYTEAGCLSAGSLELCGKRYGHCEWQKQRRQVGVVSTAIAQLVEPQDSVVDIVAAGAKGHTTNWTRPGPKTRRKAQDLLSTLDMARRSQRPWQVLSQGERQRTLIARALMGQPKLLFMDEPCSGLDPAARYFVLRDLDTLLQTQHAPSLVQVSHHVEELSQSISHALLLKQGRILAQGPVKRVLTSARLSELFDIHVQLRHGPNGYNLRIR